MREAGIGRVLVASLHQGIADILPTRLGFYENWLNAEGLREGTIGLAPLYAVLSFLRQEGDAYQIITTRAGEYAAEWTVAVDVAAAARAHQGAAARGCATRVLLGLARRLVRSSYRGSRAIARLRKGTARIDVRASIFCTVREPVRASALRLLRGRVHAAAGAVRSSARGPKSSRCRGTGEPTCVLERRGPRRASRRTTA